ncbi:MAG: hypothetical protein QOK38_1839, partial [Acidobacteriaceae bacterium]|nr:hypothetical protein [Acidobacteriaceae bacterium]
MKAVFSRVYSTAPSLMLLLVASACFGQTPGTGAISGLVSDPAKRAVANAEVLAVDDATHISRSVTTTPGGVFRVPLLPPGRYTVTVKAPQFAVNVSSSVQVAVSETTSLNITLAVAGTSATVQ